MKIKIDLNFEMFDLENRSIGFANKILAGFLMSEFKGDSVKLFDWAMSLNQTGIVELDNSDLESLLSVIKPTERVSVMAKAPIIKHLNSLKN